MATKNEPCPVCQSRGGDSRGNNRIVYPDGGWHCFACGDHRSGSFNPVLPKEVDGLPAAGYPSDLSEEVPIRAWEWILQFGLGWKYWQPYLRWSEKSSRLVIQVGSPPEFAIGRYIAPDPAPVEGRLGTSPPKWRTYGNCHRTAHVFGDRGSSIVLVEDIISAHKVGQVNLCIPLFGTRIFGSVLSALRLYRFPVVLWLDKDQDPWSRERASHLNLMTGLPVRYVSTSNDPKNLSITAIEEVLS